MKNISPSGMVVGCHGWPFAADVNCDAREMQQTIDPTEKPRNIHQEKQKVCPTNNKSNQQIKNIDQIKNLQIKKN